MRSKKLGQSIRWREQTRSRMAPKGDVNRAKITDEREDEEEGRRRGIEEKGGRTQINDGHAGEAAVVANEGKGK